MLALPTLALAFSAFCTDRPSCSSHGDCDCVNGVCHCQCDLGFSGAHCETAACKVTCHHGGTCNTAGTACDCPASSGWSGANCTTWDPSHLPNGTLAKRLQGLKNSSADKLQSNIVKYGSKICKPGQECVGWGVDVTNGKMGSGVAMLDLSYDSSHSSCNLVFPKGVTVNGFDAPDFDEPDARAFHPVGPSCTVDKVYAAYSSWKWPTAFGGNPASGTALNASAMAAWQASVADAPVLVDYTMTPLSPFISDEHVKSVYDDAVEKYVAEQKAAQPKAGCPPTCNGKGTCASGATKCTCTDVNPGQGGDVCWSGRQCSTFEYSGTFTPQTWTYRAFGGPAGNPPGIVIKSLAYDQCTKQLKEELPGGYWVYKNNDTCQTGCQIRQDGEVCAWAYDAGSTCVGPWVSGLPGSSDDSVGTSCHHTKITCTLKHAS